MGDYITKTREKVSRYSNILVIIFAAFLLISLVRNINRINKAGKRIEEKSFKVQDLAEDNEKLKRQLEEIESTEYIEKQIRNNLGMAREGEIVIVLPEDDVLRVYAPEEFVEEDVVPVPNWVKWKNLFI